MFRAADDLHRQRPAGRYAMAVAVVGGRGGGVVPQRARAVLGDEEDQAPDAADVPQPLSVFSEKRALA